MTILVTGAAGFIGYHTSQALLKRGEVVIGIDNLNDYYPVKLKQARLAHLESHPGFRFFQMDIADPAGMAQLMHDNQNISRIVHLASQAGVRYSLENPYAYIQANVMGQTVICETARLLPHLTHVVYASSSSVYGANTALPFSVEDRVDHPVSLYAATKRSAELIAATYARLYRIPLTGLRFFTVYGPWGRPDMAAYLFADAITAGRPIKVFNHGKMLRDFTYIDDIIAGTLAALDHPPQDDGGPDNIPHRTYNLGSHRPEALIDFIAILEQALGIKAQIDLQPMQPGDVAATYADIAASQRDLGFEPVTPLSVGLPRFVSWYREYNRT
ncbi:MAG: SDR family NAD(P)-dependent oxidoreductase [Azospirillaceae bacterium]|nr:SDR family NAD(P)-dependent oxidoreductase [Azospirillaceae bacterium]